MARKKRIRHKSDRVLEKGRASDYIRYVVDEIKAGDKVILVCRVSTIAQELAGNLEDQEIYLRQICAELGAFVIGVITFTGPGNDPFWLWNAGVMAKRFGAKLLAETTDRFIRHPKYHSYKHPDAQAPEIDLQELQIMTCCVTLVTVCHPDTSPAKVRSYQSKRGQSSKGKRGGRPSLKKKCDSRPKLPEERNDTPPAKDRSNQSNCTQSVKKADGCDPSLKADQVDRPNRPKMPLEQRNNLHAVWNLYGKLPIPAGGKRA